MKKKILSVLCVALLVLSVPVSAIAATLGSELALITKSDATFAGSAQVLGNMEIVSGTLKEGDGIVSVTGTAYLGKDAVADTSNNAGYDVATQVVEKTNIPAMPTVKDAPNADFFAKSTSGYTDGSKSMYSAWPDYDLVLNDDAYLDTISIPNPGTLTIDTSKKSLVVIRVKTLNIGNILNVKGNGKVVIYADSVSAGSYSSLNPGGDSASLAIVYTGTKDVHLDNYDVVNATIFAMNASSLSLKVNKYSGNVYTNGNLTGIDELKANGYICAPNSDTTLYGSAHIKGQLVTNTVSMSGNAKVEYAPNKINPNDFFEFEDKEKPKDPEPTPVDPTPVDPTPVTPVEPDEPTGETIKLGIVTPKKMSVRFEDGSVYYGGESLKIEIGKTYHFQMCSNNWDNDKYDDNGNGICGTVVYSVKVSNSYTERSYDPETKTFVLPKGDPVLRTDVNKCFMAYRYHFEKGDYQKQTGIKHVINTPLESLSVNLPLGSTITSDAYIGMSYIDS
ncbi:MAG: hypothetical protein K2K01_01965, partial [Eubacterium sp.]|nr:hypothetical protein [Eubacterium sp.]